jgi:hypothetical protein
MMLCSSMRSLSSDRLLFYVLSLLLDSSIVGSVLYVRSIILEYLIADGIM